MQAHEAKPVLVPELIRKFEFILSCAKEEPGWIII